MACEKPRAIASFRIPIHNDDVRSNDSSGHMRFVHDLFQIHSRDIIKKDRYRERKRKNNNDHKIDFQDREVKFMLNE